MDRPQRALKVTVSGSFTKHWAEITKTAALFRELGVEILSPPNNAPVRKEDGFVYLRKDAGTPADIERAHLRAIQSSDFLYVVNTNGYVGPSVAMELGYALAWGIPIWSSEPFSDVPHRLLVEVGAVETAVKQASKRLTPLEVPVEGRLGDLQTYVRDVSSARGFSDETPSEIFVLLVEEVGELAKALRAHLSLSMSSRDRSSKDIQLELADCLIYVLHFANRLGINLLAAFHEKERLNANKKWAKPLRPRPL